MELIDKKISLMIWKTSNIWLSILRKTLKKYSLTPNEFIILETLYSFKNSNKNISQVFLSKSSGIDIAVISSVLKILDKKSLIKRKIDTDNRKKIVKLTTEANTLLNKILPLTDEAEIFFFKKLGNEKTNFCNALKLILGKKIRIQAERD